MNVSSTSTVPNNAQTVAQKNISRGGESAEVGRDRDGDGDDGGSVPAAVASQPPATVNTQGQVIGQLINVKA